MLAAFISKWHSLDRLVASCLRSLDGRLARHAVETHLPAELPLLEIDAVLIERVLCNLIDNAIKYAPDSLLLIEAKVSDSVVDISVSDSGSGLTPGTEESVFKWFERGSQHTRKTGTGLGLSICRAIVEAHGGTIRARNRTESGASFSFTLPMTIPPISAASGPTGRSNGGQ
jgi:two-component system sensor histidine kinase KdpD